MKGGDIIINEYLLTVKTLGENKLYKVYAPNEKIALNKFMNMCSKYQDSRNFDNKEHWKRQSEAIISKSYSILRIDDFCGVREII